MKLFQLRFSLAPTGVEVTAANGIVFPNGWCAVSFVAGLRQPFLYEAIADVEHIYCAPGSKLKLVWIV